ncbi:MFS general substrate transporter [Dothidotthia symphoricarpi CBS 119687]|uniref:MFS general substrate transporter n=1 Tax=Dothidotthia symphoricarpi CBS 119687 TaxID=1392245 RepID=A0A6A6A714_9PLEO|nr:MFS general substrate transporter [Dothidotthia symphoricarpi CBS 119687]KAF2127802.1 MFS general substrate transporter [Dothidotthia symphoricarpi CBS 119687]
MASLDAESSTERTPLLLQDNTGSSVSSLCLSSTQVSTDQPPKPTHSKTCLDEEARLDEPSHKNHAGTTSVGQIVSVLLIGSFISNADTSLLFATHTVIASEFNALHDSSWLLTSFALAQAASQPLYGKISDIYGRKSLLLLAYTLFAVGCGMVGMGTSMSHLIVGRVVSGAGSAGMTALVSILITDLVSLREVASWRSYVNVVATTGRSIGGPLGGWLADAVGWRWSFLGQVPLAGIAIILVAITLPPRVQHHLDEDMPKGEQGSKLARVDFLGATLLTLTILMLLFPLEIGGDRIPWSSPIIFLLFGTAVVCGTLFLATEAWIAREPIIPLSLLRHRDIVVSSLTMIFQVGAQTGMMLSIPLYFQVTAGASNSVAGLHLSPAVVGNAVGGILSGIIIKRTGRYKSLIIVATLGASIGYLLLILRWHGNTNWLESLYIIPGGFGTGIAQSALFISVQAAIDPTHTAIAASTLYLSSSVGSLAGMAGASAVLQGALRKCLNRRLGELDLADKKKWSIIEHAVSDLHYLDKAKPLVAGIIRSSYVEALTWAHLMSFLWSLTAFVGSFFLRQHKL